MNQEVSRICTEVIDDIVQVGRDEVLIAIRDTYGDTRHILEYAGTMSVAGLKRWVISNGFCGSEKGFIAITSEANMDFFSIPDLVRQVAVAE